MKTLIFLLALVASLTGLDVYGAVNSGGGINGGGSGTANFTNLTSAPGGQSLIKQNTGTNVVLYSLTNSGAVTLSTNLNSIIIGVAIGTNDVTLATNSFAINTVQTNNTTNILFSANSLLLTPTATEGVKASLVVETAAGSGSFVTISQVGSQGIATFEVFTNSVYGFVPPGARFYVTNQSIGSATAAVSIGYREYLLATTLGGGIGGNVTNDIRLLVNGTNVTWPAYLTNSSSISITNVNGQISFTRIGASAGTVTGITNIGGGVSLINDSNSPVFVLKSLTNSTAGISFTDNLTNIGATLSANLLLWNSVTTNQFTDTNRFQLATNGIIGMFRTFTNTAIDTNTFQSTTNLLVDTNRFELATNGIIGMFTTFTNTAIDTNTFQSTTNLLVDTNRFQLATNGIIGMFTAFTNVATDTNIFRLATNGIIGMFTSYTNVGVDTNVFRQATNGMVIKQNNNTLKWPVLITNSTTVTWGTNADGSLVATGATAPTANQITDRISISIDGGGSAITTGIKGQYTLPFDLTLYGYYLIADQSGSLVLDVWYTNGIPSVTHTITGNQKPTLTTAQSQSNLVISAWYTNLQAGRTIFYNVDSATTVTRATLVIFGRK